MTRWTYAAKTLRDEVRALAPDAEFRPVGEPDGLGVFRALRVKNVPWLAETMPAVRDDRITEVADEGEDGVVIEFVGDRTADTRDLFGVRVARKVMDRQSFHGGNSESAPAKKAAKKAPAKKAAKKAP